MRRIVSAIGVMSLAAMGGCQSWSQVGQGFPSNTRVAPPGTGTYNVPSSYYNGGKGAAVGSNIPSTSAGGLVLTHPWVLKDARLASRNRPRPMKLSQRVIKYQPLTRSAQVSTTRPAVC